MKSLAVWVVLSAAPGVFAVSEKVVLWKSGENDIGSYRIPALATAPNGDLVAACDARKNHGGDLNSSQPINISVRRSVDGGKTWTPAVYSHQWPFNEKEKWAGSDPSMIVDSQAKKIFLLYNVWNIGAGDRVFRFYVQESRDNGKTWSKPRDISRDIAFEGWPFGKSDRAGGFIFISSGSGIQTKDGTLLHTLVHVGDGNALFGSPDHGKTWKSYGRPATPGDECKVVELSDGSWMINSRWRGGGRQIHVSRDRGQTWESRYDQTLKDPQCNAQLMTFGPKGKVLLFSNCNSNGRNNLFLRASIDNGQTWSEGIRIEPGGAAYSDITVLKDGKTIGCLYEGAGYSTIDFVAIPVADVKSQFAK
ncbi:MAG: exo-alpha-sialidase [Kiritimatiellia bacterium]